MQQLGRQTTGRPTICRRNLLAYLQFAQSAKEYDHSHGNDSFLNQLPANQLSANQLPANQQSARWLLT